MQCQHLLVKVESRRCTCHGGVKVTELAERYGWINRALPADALGDFVRSLAHRIASFPAAGQVAVKERVNAIALAPAEDFRRDSDLFGEGVRNPGAQSRIKPSRAYKQPWECSDPEAHEHRSRRIAELRRNCDE